MFRASYSQAGLQGVLKDGAAARTTVVQTEDSIAIVELPNDIAAAAAAMTVGASGVGSVTTTVLLTGPEVDEARTMRPVYRAPGA